LSRKTFSGMMVLALLLIGMLTLAFNIPYVKADSSPQVGEKVTIKPIADTYIDRLYHWKNFGDQNILGVLFNWSYPGGQTCYISFLKFDLSGIPASAKIISAELYLRIEESSVGSTEVTTIKSHRYSNNTWDEDELTWDNVDWDQIQNPTSETEIYVDLLETQVWFNWTITEDIKNSKDGFLTEVLSASGGESIFFYSKETASKPYLNITYTFSTPVGGIIWENTTWTLENSPYVITDTVQIPENVTLTIEPGVTVTRPTDGDMFLLHGIIYAYGVSDNKITFDGGGNSNFFNAKSSGIDALVDLDYCIIKNGYSLWPATGYAQYGSFNLRHSLLMDLTSYSYFWGQETAGEKDFYIEYNTFYNMAGFSGGLRVVYIRNNLFVRNRGVIVENQAGPAPIVTHNSFIGMKGIVLKLSPGYGGASIVAPENYWGTLNTSLIDSMIYDKNDDINCAGFVDYLPILSEPHPDTPKILSTIYVDDDNTAGPWDGTVEHPYQNISQGLTHASENDTLFVYNGTYYENVVVNKTISLIGESRENTIIDARGIGKTLELKVDKVLVSNFTISYGEVGIHLTSSHGHTIRNNIIRKNTRGATGDYYTNTLYEENIVTENDYGLDFGHLMGPSSINNTAKNNVITNNFCGIYVSAAEGNNTIRNNIIEDNSIGIVLDHTKNNKVIGNLIRNNNRWGGYMHGIHMRNAVQNLIDNNIIENNHVGVFFEESNDNKIHHNNFAENPAHISGTSLNVWDDGYPSGGNYWSDYAGVDL